MSFTVLKRNGNAQDVSFDKIIHRLSALCKPVGPPERWITFGVGDAAKQYKPNPKIIPSALALTHVSPALLAQRVVGSLYNNVKTTDIDKIASIEAMNLSVSADPQYQVLASRLLVSDYHKNVQMMIGCEFGCEFMHAVYALLHDNGKITTELWELIQSHGDALASALVWDRDYDFNYFGWTTLYNKYLIRLNEHDKDFHVYGNFPLETPQLFYMRVSAGLFTTDPDDVASIINTYNGMSQRLMIHATPTLFNAGTPLGQLSSCFVCSVEDSVESMYDQQKRCAIILKNGGGVGISVSCIRARGSTIRSTGGKSKGLVSYLKTLNEMGRHIDQGGKRPGAIAVYLEMWHADVFDFIDSRNPQTVEDKRISDLFLALWVPDLFMKRLMKDELWTLMSPDVCPGLCDVYGKNFEELYLSYEARGLGQAQVSTVTLWNKILKSQLETGLPYLLFKDSCNEKSNQKNIGTIRGSNLCAEILIYHDGHSETAVCNLASIALPACCTPGGEFNFELLGEVTKQLVVNLNRVIEVTKYPDSRCEDSNMRHRPIGIGIQGMADVFALMRVNWESEEARVLTRDIMKTIYYHALLKSHELACGPDGAYEGHWESPLGHGQFQFNLHNLTDDQALGPERDHQDWKSLRCKVQARGVANSLLVALMPTATTSCILGFNECFEPFTFNVYIRKTINGEFQMINQYLVEDLRESGVWSPDLLRKIIRNKGSVQNIPEIPSGIRQRYKLAKEIDRRALVDLAVIRGRFCCQSQSFNVYTDSYDMRDLNMHHFLAWKGGLKTSSYYTHGTVSAAATDLSEGPVCETCSA